MNDDNACQRAVELTRQIVAVLRRIERAPASPVDTFVSAKQRRQLRRDAERLRQGKTEPRYKNLRTAEELADVYERTAERDEIFEQAARDLKRLNAELRALGESNPEVKNAVEAFVRDSERAAEEQGPGSEAAEQFRIMRFLNFFGQQILSHGRRQRGRPVWRRPLRDGLSIQERDEICAAELLASPPASGEPIVSIPQDGSGSGRERIFLRIGSRKASWIGSFERGDKEVCTISLLPDDKHLFVSAGGIGYIIDAKSRTLVEKTGTEVVGVAFDETMTVFIVNHNVSLEVFGRSGRLWKTDAISAGGFRRVALNGDELVGEAWQSSRRWASFSVKLATGEVDFGR